MDLSTVLRVFVTASLVYQSGAFLPSHAVLTLPGTDYTLTDITVQGILRAVAKYFEDTNPDKYSPGDLTNLSPLTPSRLYRRHYGDCVYSTKFERAIKAILDENIRISDKLAHKAVWHFNGNQINKGNRKIKSIRDVLLNQISAGDENTPDYDTARLYCGQFLHMAHSFYSNTNWIELNRWLNSLTAKDPNEIITSSDLGIVSPLTWRQSPGNYDMCQNCPVSVTAPVAEDCSNNLRQNVYYLTSGYRQGQDKVKPAVDPRNVWGKCSHGGINDASRTLVATGGINKETSDLTLSPHYHLHEQAALTAIQATQDFFYHSDTGLYALIGERKFRKLLNLDVGTSLTFVIDTTGSMKDDIAAVKDQTIYLVNKHQETCLAASKYVLVPFNDPSVGPALVTTDAQECIDSISSLVAQGGVDCPEMSNSGLELGLQHSLESAKVYAFTDASDKDKSKLPDVLALIVEKNVQVTFLLTGTCSGDRRRKREIIDWSKVSSSYETIASASGGEIYRTDKEGIGDLARILEGDIRASQVTITKKTSVGRSTFDVDMAIDSSVGEVLVSLVGSLQNASISIRTPSGSEGSPSDLGADIFTSSDAQMVFSINVSTSGSRGTWILQLAELPDPESEYKVKVSANSVLDFDYEILEVDTAYPIDGLPVAGSEVLVTIQVSAPEIVDSVSEIRLHDSTGQETLVTVVAEPVTGRTAGLYAATVTLPNKPFFMSIVGMDTERLSFLRTQPSEVQVVNFKLEQVLDMDAVGTDDLVPGGEGNFTFQVTNSGPTDTLTVSVSVLSTGADTASALAAASSGPLVSASVEPVSMTLATGETGEGTVTVTAAADAPIGTSAKITLSVQSASSSALNFLSTDVTVFEVQLDQVENPADASDSTPPICTVLETRGGCTPDQIREDCHLHSWWMRFMVTDETSITEVSLNPEIEGSSQNLGYESFSLQNTTAKYSATCCCPTISIVVQDGVRNNATCGKDYYTPVAGKVDKPVCNGPIPSPHSGLSTGAIIGIAVGSAAALVILGAIVIWLLIRNKYSETGVTKTGSISPLAQPSKTEPVKYKNTAFDEQENI